MANPQFEIFDPMAEENINVSTIDYDSLPISDVEDSNPELPPLPRVPLEFQPIEQEYTEYKENNDIDYNKVSNIATEARQKFSQVRPLTIGQASRISGISPADISVLLIYLQTM